jgi:DNA-binding IscR family transcriptional regulator
LPAGGFALELPPGQIRLLDIVEALDGASACQHCPMGLAVCSDAAPCAMHNGWMGLRSRIMEYLERSTIADLAAALEKKKRKSAAARNKKVSAGTKRV